MMNILKKVFLAPKFDIFIPHWTKIHLHLLLRIQTKHFYEILHDDWAL